MSDILISDESLSSPNQDLSSTLAELQQAVAYDLELLAYLHDSEPTADLLKLLKEERFPVRLGLRLESESGRAAAEQMQGFISSIADEAQASLLDELAVDFADIYLTHKLRASPCESVWIDEDRLLCQITMFQVREWYERYGYCVENWRIRPDDHLVLQLNFISQVLLKGGGIDALVLIARFMDEHLLRWLPSFCNIVSTRCSTKYYSSLAILTLAYCEEFRDLIATLADQERPSRDDIDNRMASIESSPVEDPEAFVPGVNPSW